MSDVTAPVVRAPMTKAMTIMIRAATEVESLGYLPDDTRDCLTALGYTAAQIEQSIATLRGVS